MKSLTRAPDYNLPDMPDIDTHIIYFGRADIKS